MKESAHKGLTTDTEETFCMRALLHLRVLLSAELKREEIKAQSILSNVRFNLMSSAIFFLGTLEKTT